MTRARVARLALGVGVIACGDQPARPRPAEIPIHEYRVDESSATMLGDASATGVASPSSSSERDRDRERDASADTKVSGDAPKSDGKITVATQLDVKGGFLGATFGASPRAFRGLVALDKRNETFRAPAKSYGGFALRDIVFSFRKGKLGTIQFAAKSNDDCKPVREAFVRELGPPQRASVDNATSTWRGEKIAMRFVITSSGACSATVVNKEHARMEFDAL